MRLILCLLVACSLAACGKFIRQDVASCEGEFSPVNVGKAASSGSFTTAELCKSTGEKRHEIQS